MRPPTGGEEAADGERPGRNHLPSLPLWFKVGYEVGKGEKKPICSDDGLVELGKTITGKLP